MPLVPQQAILYGEGNTVDSAIAHLEKQMDELPDVKIVSISLYSLGAAHHRVLAVVETV